MEKPRIPPSPLFLHNDVSEGVFVSGRAMADVLPIPSGHDPPPLTRGTCLSDNR